MSKFSQHVDSMPALKADLLAMDPVDALQVPKNAPAAGVYLFLEKGKPVYVGRSNRIRERVAQHRRPGSGPNVAALAMLISRQMTKRQASYKPEGSREDLMSDPEFKAVFDQAKRRISLMQVQYVEISDPMQQAMFEMYLADALSTPFNSWKNH